jgi:hypothetical protein
MNGRGKGEEKREGYADTHMSNSRAGIDATAFPTAAALQSLNFATDLHE